MNSGLTLMSDMFGNNSCFAPVGLVLILYSDELRGAYSSLSYVIPAG
jgi:hypothetical protein